jgi:hypothetical protein
VEQFYGFGHVPFFRGKETSVLVHPPRAAADEFVVHVLLNRNERPDRAASVMMPIGFGK